MLTNRTIRSFLYLRADVLAQKGAEPGSAEFQTAMRFGQESGRPATDARTGTGSAGKVAIFKAGQYAEAAAQCKKALELDPEGSNRAVSPDPGGKEEREQARTSRLAQAARAASPGCNERGAGTVSIQTGRGRRPVKVAETSTLG